MPKYYIAADGGGSKLQAVLYDDDFNVIRTARVKGVNALFIPPEVVKQNIRQVVDSLITPEDGEPISEIEAFDFSLVGAHELFDEVFADYHQIKELRPREEGEVGMAAALKRTAILALSGTGSDVFFRKDGELYPAIGGWGPLLGDEGSGYEIGLNTIKAAIRALEDRGEKTCLYDMVMERFGVDMLWRVVHRLAKNPDQRHEVASCALLCSKAAAMGDKVALGIYEDAAREMYLLTRTAIKRYRSLWDGVIVVAGGAWRGSPVMLEKFTELIIADFPEAKVVKPTFEPVIGCAVLRQFDRGRTAEEILEPMKRGFANFLYN